MAAALLSSIAQVRVRRWEGLIPLCPWSLNEIFAHGGSVVLFFCPLNIGEREERERKRGGEREKETETDTTGETLLF